MPKRAFAPKRPEHLALRYYRLGQQLLERDAVGEEEFKSLATALGLDDTYDAWYKSVRLAKLFKGNLAGLVNLCRFRRVKVKKEIKERRIGWSHVIELLQVSSATQRERFAALVVRHNLDSAALRQEIRRKANRPSLRPRSGRKQREPRSKYDAAWRAEVEIGRLKTTLRWLEERFEQQANKELVHALNSLSRLQKSLGRMVGSA